MIFGIKTERSDVTDKFVDNFRNPKNPNMALLHASIYIENKVDWVDEVLVFRQKSVVDGFAKFGIVSSLGIMLIGLFMQSYAIMQIGLLLVILCMASISPLIRFFSIALKLFIMGHRKKITMVTKEFLLEKLFFKLEM